MIQCATFAVMLLTNYQVSSAYETPSPLAVQLIIEFSKWQSWKQVVIFDDLTEGGGHVMKYTRPLLRCFSEQGVGLSLQPTSAPRLPEALDICTHRLGAIVFLDRLNNTSADNVLQLASSKRLFDYYISWLLITTRPDDVTIDTYLRNLTIGINSEVVVATASQFSSQQREQMRGFTNRTCRALRDYAHNHKYRNATVQSAVAMKNVTQNLAYSPTENSTACFRLVHIYKIRISDNCSLVVDPLGSWNPGSMMLRHPVDVVLRDNFHRLPIVVGVLNGTSEDQDNDGVSLEDQTPDDRPFDDFINFVANGLNASLETVLHEKVGTITNKVWSNLLGDVTNGNIDIGLGYITINDERLRDMCFSHPLIRYTRNIYIRPPESGTMRDIFLQPFNNRLLLGVAFVHVIIVVTIGTINYALRHVFNHSTARHYGYGEATLWCTSIMCMQGSPWNPCTLSGKLALLASLIFALVTYNAYAGFITSILSVQVPGIKTLEDLLQNNFKVGYSEYDDEFMRNANDSNLRQLYIKAFNGRESRLDTTLGLQRAINGRYGFFVSATSARRILKTTLIQQRCYLKEIEVKQTFTTVALPMEKDSPYKKIINLSILRMRERGVIDRIVKKMLPDMPNCNDPTTFHSARIADVYSAFIIIAAGIVMSVSITLLERIWSQRNNLKNRLTKGVSHHIKKNSQFPTHLTLQASENLIYNHGNSLRRRTQRPNMSLLPFQN
uniref:Ionotropic receptor 3 n=1 Tax=Aulacocentrum confusum TaxID=2767324 RepID=A0A7G8Z9H5_9HYME|nr:ionotropic receptor 3 [Aulacocentrum confusum]